VPVWLDLQIDHVPQFKFPILPILICLLFDSCLGFEEIVCQGVRPRQIRKGANQVVVGWLMGDRDLRAQVVMHGIHTEISARHERHCDLYWFGPLESKTLHPVWWWYYPREVPSKRESTYPWGAPQAALYWLACLRLQVGFHLSYSVTTWKAYPSWTILSCTPSCLHVFGPTSQVR
jgi:hypothetical protein